MKRIRLQVSVLPWEEPASQSSNGAQTRQEVLRPWLQVCTEDMSLQDLADKIVSKFSSIHAGRGTLNIKHLETDWGDILDLADNTVGDIFDDRLPSGENRTSIVKVARFPPDDSSELRSTERFASLLPESSARPRKRPFAQSPPRLQNDTQHLRHNGGWVHERSWDSHETANKRPRIFTERPHGVIDSDRPLPSFEDRSAATYHSSQISGTQDSVNQIYDSQASPSKKRLSVCTTHFAKLTTWKDPNPYGTPLSLSQDRLLNQPNAAIPDSPRVRRMLVVNVDRESTKSESPELRLSVHQVPPASSIPMQKDQTEKHRQLVEPAGQFEQYSSRIPSENREERSSLCSRRHAQEDWGHPPNHVGHKPETNRLATDADHGKDSRESNNAQRKGEDLCNAIKTDTESFQDKQRMHSVKRLRLNEAPSHDYAMPSAPQIHPVHQNGDHLLPTFPKPRLKSSFNMIEEHNSSSDGDTPIPLDDGFQQLIRAAASDEGSKTTPRDKRFTKGASRSSDNGALSITEREPNSNRSIPSRHLFERQPGPLACRSPVQAPNAQWTSDSRGIVNAKSPKLVEDEGDHLDDEAFNPKEDLMAEENEVAKRKAEEVRISEDEQKAAQKTQVARVAEKVKAHEEKAHIDEQAEADGAEQTKDMEGQFATGHWTQGLQAIQDDQATAENKRRSDARRAKDKEIREKDLAKQAERMMLVVDGAKQLEVEKARKNEASAPSKAQGSTPEAPRILKYRERTPDQKAKRKERDAQRKAEQDKAAEERKASEEKRAFERARTLAEANAKETKINGTHARLVSEKEKTPKGQLKSESVNRKVQKHRNSSEARSSPSSLTPVLPAVAMKTQSLSQTNGMSSDTLRSKSGQLDVVPRSALRQTSSALRRSVSFQDDHPLPGPDFSIQAQLSQTSQTSGVRSMKSLIDINNDLAARTSFTPKSANLTTNTEAGQVGKTLIATKGKVQTRLNVTRDKKMKGRAVDPPSPAKPPAKEELVISSDEDSVSSYYSDEEEGVTVNAKAGPSSKKKPARPDPSLEKNHVTPSSSIDPALQHFKPTDSLDTIAVSDHSSSGASSTAASRASSTQSVSRSPAQPVSESPSSSSGSESETDSVAEIIHSSSKSPPAPSQQVESSSKARQRQMPATDGAMSSQSSQTPSFRSRSVVSTSSSSARRADQAADMQLQLETKQSLTPTLSSISPNKAQAIQTNKDASSTTSDLPATRRTPNGRRPANNRFPTMTELKLAAAANPSPSRQTLDRLSPVGGSQRRSSMTNIEFNVTSSDEDSSSSDSDDDEADTSKETDTKPKSGFGIPGMKGLMKLAIAGPSGTKTRKI